MSGYIVREARDIDIEKITDLGERVHSETIYAHIAYDRDKVANLVACGILKQPNWWLRVISLDRDIVGGMLCIAEPALCSRDVITRDVTIMVDKAHRARCLKQLVEMVELYKAWSIQQGAKIIFLGASSGVNVDGASKLFTALGFDYTGVLHTIRRE